MTKLPLPPNERERIEELQRYALLDTPPEKAFDSITLLAAQIFHTPIAAVTLIDQDRQWFKSCIGLETREVGRNFAFCAHAILGTGVMTVPDAHHDVRFANNPLVLGPPYIRFYAGAPLRTKNGLNLGTLTVSDTKPRQMTEESTQTLTSLAALVVSEIELRHERGEHARVAETLRLLLAAVQQSRETIMITTAELDLPGPEIVFVNPAFTALTGYSAEEVLGKTPRLFQGAKTDRALLDDVRTHLKNKVPFHGEAVNYRKDGSTFLIGWDIAPIRDAQGEVTHFIGFQRDCTETNRAAAALLQAKEDADRAREEAERANKAKSEFLSRMSHELRTPLHAILGYSQLLELDGLGVQDKESVAHILLAGNHLLGLINEILDLARVESGHLVLNLERVNLCDLLAEMISLLRPLAAEREVRLEDPVCHQGCDIFSDAQRFRQVILNLLSNAVKFNRVGGTVSVSCEKVPGSVRIEVVDTGDGISAENLGKLFVPFERLGISESAYEGTGLGLSLSKHLVAALGGRMGVKSEVGQGTTFWVEMPLAQGVSRPWPTPPAAGVEAVQPAEAGTPRSILYIEDNPSNFRLVERILVRRPEVSLTSASSGTAGLAAAFAHSPDFILLDLHLPDLQGDEVLLRLRSDPRTEHTPVAILSADATRPAVERLRALGANDYLTKPIDVRHLLRLIDSIKPCSEAVLA